MIFSCVIVICSVLNLVSSQSLISVNGGVFGDEAADGLEKKLPSSKGPEFAESIGNVTVPLGKEAILTCSIRALGDYKVVWMKAEDQTVFSIHKRLVPQSSKYGLSFDGTRIWRLHIRHVKESDQGCYVCQINTSPMKQQSGCIDVLVPPDIDDDRSTSDTTVNEGEDASLTCHATGRPAPRVIWRREDGDKIVMVPKKGHDKPEGGVKTQKIQDMIHNKNQGNVAPPSQKSLSTIFQSSEEVESNKIRVRRDRQKVESFAGEILKLHRITRKMIGAYLCIASNDVPPAVSKRVVLNVNFAPNVRIETQLVGAPLGSVVRLECKIEAYPTAVNYWIKNRGNDVILRSKKYELEEERISSYQIVIGLVIREVSRSDFGTYSCVSTNSLGKGEETVRLYELKVNSPSTSSYAHRPEPQHPGPTSKEEQGIESTAEMTQQDIAPPNDTPTFYENSNLFLNQSTPLRNSSRRLQPQALNISLLFALIAVNFWKK